MSAPIDLIPSRGKNPKYRPPDMTTPIMVRDIVIPVKVVDGQRIISARAIAEAMADDKFTALDLHFMVFEERLIWGSCKVE